MESSPIQSHSIVDEMKSDTKLFDFPVTRLVIKEEHIIEIDPKILIKSAEMGQFRSWIDL